MGELRVGIVFPNGHQMDATKQLTGLNQDLPVKIREDWTDWNKWIEFWNNYDAYTKKRMEEEKNANNH